MDAENPNLNPGDVNPPPNPPPNQPDQAKALVERSEYWKHFARLPNDRNRASCKYCNATYACHTIKNGTKNLKAHLGKCKEYPPNHELKRQTTLLFKTKEEGNTLVPVAFSIEACRKALAEMIIIDELSFRHVEGEGFKRFMNVVCPKLSRIPSRMTVARDCVRIYWEEKAKLKNALKGRKISITTDTWTSIQNLSYMCLTAHFIDNDWKLHKRILNFVQVPNHKGETIGKVVEKCLIDWEVDGIFTVTVDNATSNNGAIEYLRRKTKGWKGSVLDNEFIHMRCTAHILNLIVSDGIKEVGESVTKIRTAVKYVRSSPSRLAKFKECVDHEKITCKKMLCLDVSTRWNSTYMMLEAAGKFEKAFSRMEDEDLSYSSYFGEEEGKKNNEKNDDDDGRVEDTDEETIRGKKKKKVSHPPTDEDWEKTQALVHFLKIFYDATLRFSGSYYVTSNTFFHELVIILTSLEKLSKSEDMVVFCMADRMRRKFEKYWNVSYINPLLFISVVLDPRYKMHYLGWCFEKLYSGTKADDLKTDVKKALERFYGWYHSRITHAPQDESGYSRETESGDLVGRSVLSSWESQFRKHMEKENSLMAKSEVERYLNENVEDGDEKFDLLAWWKHNSQKYPSLSLLAKDVLAFPISSVASESAFSTSGRILDTFRSSLSPSTVEALVCTQDWLRSPSVAINLRQSMDDVEEYERVDAELFGSISFLGDAPAK